MSPISINHSLSAANGFENLPPENGCVFSKHFLPVKQSSDFSLTDRCSSFESLSTLSEGSIDVSEEDALEIIGLLEERVAELNEIYKNLTTSAEAQTPEWKELRAELKEVKEEISLIEKEIAEKDAVIEEVKSSLKAYRTGLAGNDSKTDEVDEGFGDETKAWIRAIDFMEKGFLAVEQEIKELSDLETALDKAKETLDELELELETKNWLLSTLKSSLRAFRERISKNAPVIPASQIPRYRG